MRLWHSLLRNAGSNTFGGVTLGNWLHILCDNRFSIDAAYWPRATIISLGSIINSVGALAERLRFGREIESSELKPPIFILGTWRSGTTHLHNLLAQDNRFAYPNLYQVTYPLTFLLTENWAARLVNLCVPKQRPQDAVKIGVIEPQEEDFAMCSMGGQANLVSWAFPRNAAFYNRFMTLDQLTACELARWKASYRYFLKKLTSKYGRPLVLKSPANTGRIKVLLEMFPEAKFVHIRRNPYDVFRSLRHTLNTAGPWWQLQQVDYQNDDRINEQLLRQTRDLYESYFAQRSLIPFGQLHEIMYEDLEREPVAQIRTLYESLSLPEFDPVEQPLINYVNSLSDYRKNVLPSLPEDLRAQIRQACPRCFEEWGYVA